VKMKTWHCTTPCCYPLLRSYCLSLCLFCNHLSSSLCTFTHCTLESPPCNFRTSKSLILIQTWLEFILVCPARIPKLSLYLSLSVCNVPPQVLILLISLHCASCKTLSLQQMQTFLYPSKCIHQESRQSL